MSVSSARRLAVSEAGLFVATVDAGRIAVLDSGLRSVIAEIGIEGTGDHHDVAFAGTPPRLVVLARSAARSTLHVIDPGGPRKLGELVLQAGARIGAVGGAHVFAIAASSGIVDVRRADLQFAQLSVRTAVTAASPLGPDQFLVASAGAFEEWTTIDNLPKPVRRLRLASPIEAQLIGGNAQRAWVVPRREPDRIEIISLGNRSTRTVELPEPVARVSPHAAGSAVIAIGARTGAAYLVHLARIAPPVRIGHGPVHDAVWLAAGRALLIWPIDGEPEVIDAPSEPAETGEWVRPTDERLRPTDDEARPVAAAAPIAEPGAPARAAAAPAEPAEEPAIVEPPSRSERLDAWRQRLRNGAAPEAAPALAITDAIPELAEHRRSEGWRGAVAAWARAILGRSRRPFPVLDPGILDEVVARLDLVAQRSAIGLIYGARLLGHHGVAAFDVAAALDWRWNDVLAGALLASGTVVWRADRLHLAAEVIATLDERPPIAGVLVGDGGSAEPIRAAVITPAELTDDAAAAWAAGVVGRRLYATGPRGEHRPARFSLEARARGLTPFLRVGAGATTTLPATCVVAVPDAALADRLSLDVRATWPHGRAHEIGS